MLVHALVLCMNRTIEGDGERMRMRERRMRERERGERRETLPQDVRAAKYETGLRDRDDDLDPVEPLLVSLSSFIS